MFKNKNVIQNMGIKIYIYSSKSNQILKAMIVFNVYITL